MISTLRVRLPAVVTALAVAALLAGCRFDPYCINRCPGLDGSIDAMAPDVQPYDIVLSECVPRGPEICDGVDNDCNGQIDDGVLPGIGATCGVTRGQCHEGVAQCVSGAIECVGSVDPRAEECNGLDDDCDRVIDNGNPGGDLPCNQTAGGMDDRHNGRGDCRLGVSACVSGHLLCQGGVLPGAEVCDARDNDCNGVIDDGNPSGGGTCGVAAGACAPGVLHCISGALACIGAGIPSAEACDLADNDCDGLIDEDFDLRTDARNCGACGHACTAPSAIGNCTAGACVVAACEPGHIDLDGIYTNGCEYLCDYTGVELCDGRDNDCNGQIDEALTAPANLCRPLGECARAVPACRGTTGWGCNYPLTVSLDASGNIIPETQCDELDNDCNGRVDDTFSTKGSACSRGLGVCTTHGTFACNAAHDGVACQAADPAAGTPEACNGLDDDCNGL
ncbi:MAG: MopE-related protein, partial [Deltaproteobacteria bacterium]